MIPSSRLLGPDRAPQRKPVGRSMETVHAVDRAQLGRLDQPRVGDHDRVQRTLELLFPELQKLLQSREVGAEVVVLPDIGLQQPAMIWTPVVDMSRSQAVAVDLAPKIFRDHDPRSE